MRILIVDDNRDAADLLAALLGGLGHAAWAVYDGPSALSSFTRRRPELCFVDIGMPGMDGYETARRLRGLPGGRQVQLVALTGYTQDDDVRRAIDAGFDRHQAKPVELETLRELLVDVEDAPSAWAG